MSRSSAKFGDPASNVRFFLVEPPRSRQVWGANALSLVFRPRFRTGPS